MKKENLENEENNENLNEIIPKLIGKSEIFTKGMNEILKSNMIFKEFDNKAKKDFYFYLDNSTKRYRGLRNGGNLDNFIKEAQILNKNKAKKILNDSFYTKLNLDEDRAGMKYNHNGPILTEINEIIKNIKEKSDENYKKKNINLNNINDSMKNENEQTSESNIQIVYLPEKINEQTEISKK